MIGGPGTIVQIDESMSVKAKNPIKVHGHLISLGSRRLVSDSAAWSLKFAKIDRRIAYCRLFQMHNVARGSIIYSDQWPAYNGIEASGIYARVHATVQSLVWYVDAFTGVHTNDVELFWKNMKMHFQRDVWSVSAPSRLT